MATKKTPKPKKLTARQIEHLKAGYPHCSKSECIGGKTCEGQKSWDRCAGQPDKTLNVAMEASGVSAAAVKGRG